MRRFQHLTYANDFPNDDVRPFRQYQNTFDYDRWTAETKLKPCTVRWTLESNDRVKWTDDAARNKYFDALKNETYTLTSPMNRIVSGENVKLPVPWQAVQFANYLEVQIPTEPGDGKPLDYSTPHVERVYYFIVDSRYISPSVTECVLVRDNWTTYVNAIDIPRIELERGHQAMAGATPAQYLANPINNLTGLTEKEPDAPDDPTKVTSNRYHPLGSGEMWLMLAIRCAFDQLRGLQKAGAKADGTSASYADNPAEWGKDYEVRDYQWGGVPDVNNIGTPVATLTTGGGSHPTGTTTIAIPSTKTTELVALINSAYPQMWNLITAAWVLPRDMFDVWAGAVKLGNVEVFHVKPALEKSLANISLKTSDFGYTARYVELTKLYTAPYAWLEVTNGDTGETATIKIEDTTGSRKIKERINLAYPYLNAQTFLGGIGSDSTVTYEWRDFDNDIRTTVIDASAWRELSNHEVPTFQLFVDSEQLWNLDNAGSARQLARENAIRAYHMNERSTNVAQLNANDSANTGLSNATASAKTGLSNATASANTGLSNATASANTGLSNATASANTGLSNATASANTGLSNATASANTGLANATASANTGLANATASADTTKVNVNASNAAAQTNAANQRTNATDSNENANTLLENNTNTQNTQVTNVVGAQNYKLENDAESDRDYATESFWANQSATFSSAVSSQAMTVATTTLAVGATIATGGAAAPIAAAGIVGTGAANVALTGYSAQVSQTKNESQLEASKNNINDKLYNAKLLNTNTEEITHRINNRNKENQKTFNATAVELSNTLNEQITNTNTETSNANAERTRNTTVANATATKDTTIANATATKDTTILTATATKDTTILTATATKDTTILTATATKDTTIANATATKTTTIENATATKTTTIENATAIKNMTIANATASKNTTVNIAQRSRNAGTFANQTALDIAQAKWNAKIKDLQRSKASEIASATGDITPDIFGVRGIQVRVMTQNDDITRRCGDDMLKHGYTWHANIETPNLNLMKNFTYWQGAPQLIPVHAPAQAVNDIAELFREGVTIWRDPDKIGASIYDNSEA